MAEGSEIAKGLAEAAAAGALGRLLHYAMGGTKPTHWQLWLWELPAAAGLGLIGFGAAEYLQLGTWATVGLIVFVSHSGVKFLDNVISKVLGEKKS